MLESREGLASAEVVCCHQMPSQPKVPRSRFRDKFLFAENSPVWEDLYLGDGRFSLIRLSGPSALQQTSRRIGAD
jgi:hypothetical protein